MGGLSEFSDTQTPNEEAHSSDGGNGSSASELRERSGASSSKTSEGGVECDLFPALNGRGKEPRISITTNKRSGKSQVNDTSQTRQNTLSEEEFENAPSGTKTNTASSHMGDEAASLQHSDHGSKHGSAAPSHTSLEGSIENKAEDSEVRGPRLRPGRAPTMQSRSFEEEVSPSARRSTRKAQTKLNDVDAAITSLQDREAELYGPLTEKALNAERARSRLDPRHPRRPLRHVPIGQYVADTEEFKNFRRVAFENDFLIQLVENPKKPASKSWHRYQKYCLASTLREIVELSVDSKDPQERKKQRELAMEDIKHDALRGFILFPQFEHNASAHFVDAQNLASDNHTVNIHALYSATELDSAHFKAARNLDKEIEKARVREKNSVPLSEFHEVIESLWEYDAALQLNELELRRESAIAASLVHDITIGEVPEPGTYRKAVAANHPEREEWLKSMNRERDTLQERGTWIMVPRSSIGKHKPVRCKYVYRKKRLKDGSLQYKSRLVACGYSQVAGLDYSIDETYAGVCSYSSMRFLMSLACQKGYILSQTDITGAYLETYLDDEIYMEPPPDMCVEGPPRDAQGRELVCLLKRGLYGLKQAGHLWSECFKEFLLRDPMYNMGFEELTGESNLYRKVFTLNGKQEEIFLGQYVDDCLGAFSSEEARAWFMKQLEARFPVNKNSTGEITVDKPGLLLSMQVRYDRARGILEFNQQAAIESIAEKTGVDKVPPRSMPITDKILLPKLKEAKIDQRKYLSIVGSLLHICQVSRPDCAYAIGVLTRHSATPGEPHMQAALNLVSYMYHTRDLVIQYMRSDRGNEPEFFEKGSMVEKKESKTMEERLEASVPEAESNSPDLYIDADYAGDPNTRRSTSGMIMMMNGGAVCWSSRLQKLCAQSSAESEIYAVTESVKEAIHFKLLCEESGIRPPNKPMTIWEDNNACIQMGHELRGSKSAKHFEVRLRFLNEQIHDRAIEFARIDTTNQLADGFTKPLAIVAFREFRDKILKKKLLK